jgi:hypothetical protein
MWWLHSFTKAWYFCVSGEAPVDGGEMHGISSEPYMHRYDYA